MSDRMRFEKRRNGGDYRVWEDGQVVARIRDMLTPARFRWELHWIDGDGMTVTRKGFPTLKAAKAAAIADDERDSGGRT